MKRLVIVLLFFIVAFSNKNLSAAIFSGVYIAPKINFKHEALNKTNRLELGKLPFLEKNNYIGGGFAVGYDLFRKTRLVPLRFDIEYMLQGVINKKDTWIQSIMASVYYDINIFFVRNNELDNLTTRALYNRIPNMSIYFGLSFGNRLYQMYHNYTDTIGKALITRSSFAFGINAGLAYNILDWFAVDLGYRYLLGFGFHDAHEVLLGARFTIR
ncbi:outer membrane beta-barrel protein [Brachyspira hyodysenteriae]|nr:outer membrane beta-barrel protein [Brachyspira hyodysenteriae]MCZ9892659.1 outer membrane beta-barrel protein [Brachyspira hyodysenteriae]MCZ9990203.1 outer membrane beta-barrel protein [Brachyspira hyodysenteriae]MCZ9998574.1 outer membrane beta-barrel protein [Brachyspira hyodysenteriae]MDA0007013.1 outer membrane beta-barrel protein [Brachyspira hyodysenteriae]MDA0029840.1 outer membrane beta-barrel protein [Brachyspira hyodysenteriae]